MKRKGRNLEKTLLRKGGSTMEDQTRQEGGEKKRRVRRRPNWIKGNVINSRKKGFSWKTIVGEKNEKRGGKHAQRNSVKFPKDSGQKETGMEKNMKEWKKPASGFTLQGKLHEI